MPATPPPQLDLFEHSAETMRRNDVLDALLRRDALTADRALQALRALDPRHPALPALETLILALLDQDETLMLQQASQALQAVDALDRQVAPAARAQLGATEATAWLEPCWRTLAARAAQLPFNPQQPEAHAVPLWLRAGDWPATAAAVQGIASWRRIPAPLGWMAVATARLQGLDAAWPLLAELAWLAAPRLAAVIDTLADPLLARLLRRFGEDFDASADTLAGAGTPALAWWPAWLLVDQPALLPHLRPARAGQGSAPERSFRLLAELLGLERQGRQADLLASRKRLRDLQPALFAAYMRRR